MSSSLLGQELCRDLEKIMRPNEVYLLSLHSYREAQHVAVYYDCDDAEQAIDKFILAKAHEYGRILEIDKYGNHNPPYAVCNFRTDNIPHDQNSGIKLWTLKVVPLPAI